MKRTSFLAFFAFGGIAGAAVGPVPDALRAPLASIEVINPSPFERADEVVRIPLKELGPTVPVEVADELVARLQDRTIPSQLLDEDGDGEADSFLILLDLEAGAETTVSVHQDPAAARAAAFPKRTQAEISRKIGGEWADGVYQGGEFVNVTSVAFNGQLVDHNYYMRYEGPGWESDKVGFRLYLDHRNAIDIFGKHMPLLALHQAGLDGYDSYHEDAPWGLDILKVGNALGPGGFGAWDGRKAHRVSETGRTEARVIANGPVRSAIRLDYTDWRHPGGQANLSAVLSIDAGQFLTEARIEVEGDDVPEMVTGIPKHPDVTWLRGETDIPNEGWTYLAAYGPQSLGGGNVGLVVFVQKGGFREFAADADNELVRLRLRSGGVSYRFGAVWDATTDAGASLESFQEWIDQTVQRLNREPRLTVRSPAKQAAMERQDPVHDSILWTRSLAQSIVERRGRTLSHGHYDAEGHRPARWSYTTGLLSFALDRVGETLEAPTFRQFAESTIGSFIGEDGSIATYDLEEFNIDKINSGKMLLRLFERTGEERYRLAAERLLAQLHDHPRTSGGAFWHKQIYPHQVWLDGVYMAAPFLSQAGRMFDRPEYIEEVVREFQIVEAELRDPETGLYWHAWDERAEQFWADPDTGLSEEFWGRGLGWYAMALVDVLDTLEEGSEEAEELRRMLRDLAEAVVAVQDPETGVWWQVLDKPGEVGNFREASATGMFVYTLARGVNQGYLDAAFADAARRGYEGLVREFFLLESDGSVSLTGICQVAGLGFGRDGSFDYYAATPVVKNDSKGLGPALLAGLEIQRLP